MNWFLSLGLRKKLISIQDELRTIRKERDKEIKRLKKIKREIDKLKSEIEMKIEKVLVVADRVSKINTKMDNALEASQEELKIANDIVIPGLVAANKTFIDRWDAESAEMARRSVLAKEND